MFFFIVTANQSNIIEILHGKRKNREKVKQFDSAELKANTMIKFSLFKFISVTATGLEPRTT